MSSTSTHSRVPSLSQVSSVTLRAVSLPRYDLEYRSVEEAYHDGLSLQAREPLRMACRFREPPGTQVVIDMRIKDHAMSATFLFRLLRQTQEVALLEWVPRRRTDPDLMGLWNDSLKAACEGPVALAKLPTDVQQKLLDTCRRTLSPNPFTVLNIHWTATFQDVLQACRELREELEEHAGHPGLNTRLLGFMKRAAKRLKEVEHELGSLEGRKAARQKFVPSHQLTHARDLAQARLEVAKMRREQSEIQKNKRELMELL